MQRKQRIAHLEPVFVTGTGTDVGKTYVTALLCRALNEWLKKGPIGAVRYYKAAISGSANIFDSDADFVIKNAGLEQHPATTTSYLYAEPVSPHLAYYND